MTRMATWVMAAAVLLPGDAAAQNQPTPEQIARAQALTQAGPEHERLASLVGMWDTEMRVRPAPGADVMTARAFAENRMILGGRFLESRSTIDMFGMSGESITLLGFDRRHGRYTSIGLDTFGTYWVSGSGPADPVTGFIRMQGEDEDPVLGHTQVFEFRLEIHDDDRYTFSVIFFDDMHTQGKGPLQVLEIIHTRRK